MCGITGLYTYSPRPDRGALHSIIKTMNDALRLRGPDSSDVWQDPELPLGLGHRRLSIIDLSEAGNQPMESHSGRYMTVYNGEIYNFKELRADLENEHNVVFHGESDTEVMLAGVEAWGFQETVSKINGMFAVAVWDRQKKMLHLARDRLGKKPLYVGWAGSTLLFASELKAFCAHPDFRRDVSRASLTSYMRFGYVPAPLCIYEQVWQMAPGCMMAIDFQMLYAGQDIKPLMEHYWSHKAALLSAKRRPITDEAVALEQFEELLAKCVQERMISDVPLGAFLSGGIDSSTVVALMQKNSNKPVKTYSIGFDEDGYDEAKFAKQIANHLGTQHHELYLKSKDALDIIPNMPEIYDEPFADMSALPTYLVSKFARENVTVALSGDGGDEMLGGYNRHVTGPKAWKIVNNIPPNLRRPFSELIKVIPTSTWDRMRPANPQFGSHMHKFSEILGKRFEGDVYMSFVSQWQAPKRFVQDGKEEIIPLVDPETQIEGLGFTESMMYWDTLSYLSGDILTKVDRASMAVSLEARAPLLDYRIFEYVWRLPLEMKIRDGQGKWLLRQVLKKYVPDEMFERPKQGFSVPIDEWLRTDLKLWAEDLLDEHDLRAQGLLNYIEVRELWNQHQKGRGNHAQKLWTVLMFQAWYKHWVTG